LPGNNRLNYGAGQRTFMKWFKHQATARNDERISKLEDRAGLEAYGFYFKMLEIVAEVIDATDKHEVSYSLSRWGRQTNITSKKWLFLSQCCSDVGLMIVCRVADEGLTKDYQISVKIPNLLKYRDNHTKNLQATYKQEVELEKEQEVELEKEKPKSKDSSPQKAPTKATRLPKDWVLPKKWGEWALAEKPHLTAEDVRVMADTFKDHWIANASRATGKKDDWQATWRNWVRNQKESHQQPQRVQEARLDFVSQVMGGRNGNDRALKDIAPRPAIEGDAQTVREIDFRLREPDGG